MVELEVFLAVVPMGLQGLEEDGVAMMIEEEVMVVMTAVITDQAEEGGQTAVAAVLHLVVGLLDASVGRQSSTRSVPPDIAGPYASIHFQ